MKNYFLIPNLDKEASLTLAEELLRLSREAGGKSRIFLPTSGKPYPEPGDIPAGTEVILAIGGDGTVMRSASAFFSLGLPILGINTGTMGFLTGIGPENPGEIAEKLLNNGFREERRMILHFSVSRAEKTVFEGYAFNDVILRSVEPEKSLGFSLYVNHEKALSCIGDGLILSSPTGSTAYNLSVGGPIVHPDTELILATPLNPHSFLSRSLILPAEAVVTLRVSGNRGSGAGLFYDGLRVPDLRAGDEITVTSPSERVRLLNLREEGFYDKLREKMTF